MQTQNRALLFDLDGTVLNSFKAVLSYLPKQIEETFTWKVNQEELAYYFNNGWSDMVRKIGKANGTTLEENKIKEFVVKARKTKNKLKCEIFPGVKEIITEAKNEKIPIALCSNNLKEDLDEILETNEITDLFDLVVGEDMVEKNKPAPDMYLKAVEHFGLNSENCLVFEDTPTGIKAAKAADIPVVAITTGTQKAEILEKFAPTICLPSLEGFTLQKALNLKK